MRYDITKDSSVLKFDCNKNKNIVFTSISFADSSKITCGTKVYANGNLMNKGLCLTEDIVSIPLIIIKTDGKTYSVIQYALTISNGNRGGALVNENGSLLGMTTFRLKDNSGYVIYGVAYSIPSNQLLEYISI